jgi:hypothetical protein
MYDGNIAWIMKKYLTLRLTERVNCLYVLNFDIQKKKIYQFIFKGCGEHSILLKITVVMVSLSIRFREVAGSILVRRISVPVDVSRNILPVPHLKF